MQISLEELRKVAQAYRGQQAVVQPLEPVPAPIVAPKAEDEQLAREIARMLVDTPTFGKIACKPRANRCITHLPQRQSPLRLCGA